MFSFMFYNTKLRLFLIQQWIKAEIIHEELKIGVFGTRFRNWE